MHWHIAGNFVNIRFNSVKNIVVISRFSLIENGYYKKIDNKSNTNTIGNRVVYNIQNCNSHKPGNKRNHKIYQQKTTVNMEIFSFHFNWDMFTNK